MENLKGFFPISQEIMPEVKNNIENIEILRLIK